MYFSDYKTREELDIKEYNEQIAEVDANAFAYIIMVDFFGVEPQYNGLPEEVISLIKDGVDDILNE